MKHPIRRCTARCKDGRRYCSWAVRHSHDPLCAHRLAASHREASHREAARRRLWEIALKHRPLERVWHIRKARPDFIAGQNRTKQVPVHAPTSEEVK
jgi:hypothetical protein